jgi:Fe-S-cluster containining protein
MFDCSKVVPKKCQADCCYYVPLPRKLVNENKNNFQTEVKIMDWDDVYCLPLTENMRCPFVDKNYKCVIYKDRPPLCKMFGPSNVKGLKCYYLKCNGNKRCKKERAALCKENEANLQRIAGKISKHFEQLIKNETQK